MPLIRLACYKTRDGLDHFGKSVHLISARSNYFGTQKLFNKDMLINNLPDAIPNVTSIIPYFKFDFFQTYSKDRRKLASNVLQYVSNIIFKISIRLLNASVRDFETVKAELSFFDLFGRCILKNFLVTFES